MAGTYDDILAGGTYGDILAGQQKQPQKKLLTPAQAARAGAEKGLAATIQGPTFGFGDELTAALATLPAALNADTPLRDTYIAIRDQQRAKIEEARKQNPNLMTATGLAASAPTMLIPGVNVGVANQLAARVLSGAVTGGLFGAVTGAGESTAEDALGVLTDAAKGGGTSAAMGGAAPIVTNAVGKAVKIIVNKTRQGDRIERIGKAAAENVGRISSGIGSMINDAAESMSPRNYAREKVGEALATDVGLEGGTVGQGVDRAARRMRTLGEGSAIVDAGKRETRRLADITVTAGGTAGNRLDALKRSRDVARGDRLAQQSAEALGTGGKLLPDAIRELEAKQAAAAAPHYQSLEGARVTIDRDLQGILQRSRSYFADAEKLAEVSGAKDPALSALMKRVYEDGGLMLSKPSTEIGKLDVLKQTLYDAATKASKNGDKNLARELHGLRRALISKLEQASPVDARGRSIYRMANDAWAGPAQAKDAAEVGANFLSLSKNELDEAIAGMGAAEREAMRIGAAQALREQVGTQAGQTKLLKMQVEPATRDRLKAVFGNDYRKIQKITMIEAKRKEINDIGAGSKTAQRMQAGTDLDESAVAQGAADMAQGGNFFATLARNARGLTSTPQPVRNEIGKILFSPNGQKYLDEIRAYQAAVDAERMRRAQAAGKFVGIIPGIQ